MEVEERSDVGCIRRVDLSEDQSAGDSREAQRVTNGCDPAAAESQVLGESRV